MLARSRMSPASGRACYPMGLTDGADHEECRHERFVVRPAGRVPVRLDLLLVKELLEMGDESGAFDQCGGGNGLHVVGEVRVVGFDQSMVRPPENCMAVVPDHSSHSRPSSRVVDTQMSRTSPDIVPLARSASSDSSPLISC